MRVVIDTNVLVSGLFWSGAPSEIVHAWKSGVLQTFMTEDIFDEYQRVFLHFSKKIDIHNVETLFQNLVSKAHVVFPNEELQQMKFCDDSDDDKFIVCALTAGDATVISGDKHLLTVSGKYGINVLTPGKFVKNYL